MLKGSLIFGIMKSKITTTTIQYFQQVYLKKLLKWIFLNLILLFICILETGHFTQES
jgi:hypothetical protein